MRDTYRAEGGELRVEDRGGGIVVRLVRRLDGLLRRAMRRLLMGGRGRRLDVGGRVRRLDMRGGRRVGDTLGPGRLLIARLLVGVTAAKAVAALGGGGGGRDERRGGEDGSELHGANGGWWSRQTGASEGR